MDADGLGREPGHGRGLAAEGFGVAADLDAADFPWLVGGDVVDDECTSGLTAILRNLRLAPMACPPMSMVPKSGL
jgi:hypothetical protein